MYAAKAALHPRVPIREEMLRQRLLLEYYGEHMPTVLWYGVLEGVHIIIFECKAIHTLHDLILNSNVPHNRLLSVWESVNRTLLQTWQSSKHQFQQELSPRRLKNRIQRINTGLTNLDVNGVSLLACRDMPIIVNGIEYGSVADSLLEIERVRSPAFGVICHGDPQPSNILVGSCSDWYFVDWEWAGRHHDWRMMFAHLFGWWSSRCFFATTEPKLQIVKKRVEISYEAFLPPHLQCYQATAKRLIAEMSSDIETDTKDINRFLSMLYFGELRFLNGSDRTALLPIVLAKAIIATQHKNDATTLFPSDE